MHLLCAVCGMGSRRVTCNFCSGCVILHGLRFRLMRVHLHVWDRGRAVHRRRGMHRQGQQKAVVRRRPAILLLCRTHISKLGHSRACCLNLVFKKSSKVNNPRENYRPGKWPCRHAFCRQTTPELRTMAPVQISTYIYTCLSPGHVSRCSCWLAGPRRAPIDLPPIAFSSPRARPLLPGHDLHIKEKSRVRARPFFWFWARKKERISRLKRAHTEQRSADIHARTMRFWDSQMALVVS